MGLGLGATTKSRSLEYGRRRAERMLAEDTEAGVRHCQITAKKEVAV